MLHLGMLREWKDKAKLDKIKNLGVKPASLVPSRCCSAAHNRGPSRGATLQCGGREPFGHPGAVRVELLGWDRVRGERDDDRAVPAGPMMTISFAGRYVVTASPFGRRRCHGCAVDYAFRPSMLG